MAETLSCTLERARPLTELVYRKTRGNPFFATQFLQGLHEDGSIAFNGNLGYWECDRIRAIDATLTDDVVEFMAGRLQKLPTATGAVLKLAACMGNAFDLETLAVACEKEREEVAADLWSALQEGLVLPLSEAYKFFQGEVRDTVTPTVTVSYRFLHDRVQQAAYSLIPDPDKEATHYRIGQLLLERIPPESREAQIFTLVGQLNYGKALAIEPEECRQLAELNLMACRRAKASAAYEAGRDYAEIGLSLLPETAWESDWELMLTFHNLAAELNALCGDWEAMEGFVQTAIDRSRSVLDRVEVYRTKILAQTYQRELFAAIAIGKEFLQELGATFPNDPTDRDIHQAVAEIEHLLGAREIGTLVDLPGMADRQQKAIVEIAHLISTPAYLCGSSALYILLIAKMIALSLRYGNTSVSAIGYALYGLINCSLFKAIEKGVQWGQLALALAAKLNDKSIQPTLTIPIAFGIVPRKFHIRETLSTLLDNYTLALETGELGMAGHFANGMGLHALFAGLALSATEKELYPYELGLAQLHQLAAASYCRMNRQVCLNLLGVAPHPYLLAEDSARETELQTQFSRDNDLMGLSIFWLHKLVLCYLFEDIESALDCAIEARKYEIGCLGLVTQPWLYFYDALTALAALRCQLLPSPRAWQRVAENQEELQAYWASHAPMNFQHKCDLIEAEKCRVSGQKLEAIELYDKAIAGAKEYEYIQDEALANELAAQFYLDWGKEHFAALYMQQAYYCYAHWGAKAKVQDLEQRYSQLLTPILGRDRTTSILGNSFSTITSYSQTATISQISSILDVSSLLKASQTLSGEIELDRLLSTLMKIIVENAGATKGVLLLVSEKGLSIEAIATRSEVEQDLQLDSLHQSIALEDYPDLPVGAIDYVRHTTDTILLDAETAQTQFASDRYLRRVSPQSLLCMPLLERGNLIGVLYLENTLTADAFSNDRIELLNALCAQAAISLSNARLYQQAQQALEDLQSTQLQLVQQEKMATLGNLVAGVAHEINNPVGFISGNISAAREHLQDLLEILALYQENASPPESIAEAIEDLDPEFIREDFPHLIASMQSGCDRIAKISTSLRTFSRLDTDTKTEFNVREGLNSTLLILKYRLKANDRRPAIEIIKNYDEIPAIQCYPGQLNQVFMNLLANAIDALDESNANKTFAEIETHPNRITISTELSQDKKSILITISDNGKGMNEEVRERIFEQGFTTKGVGKGTGLGMAIARQIVEEKHGGAIACTSVSGKGTKFTISLPLWRDPAN
ncbi:MAG: ATP-binding protein [Spirulina sp.]